MLSNAAVMPTIPVVDLARARSFYEGTLGLKPAGPGTPDGNILTVSQLLEVVRRSLPR